MLEILEILGMSGIREILGLLPTAMRVVWLAPGLLLLQATPLKHSTQVLYPMGNLLRCQASTVLTPIRVLSVDISLIPTLGLILVTTAPQEVERLVDGNSGSHVALQMPRADSYLCTSNLAFCTSKASPVSSSSHFARAWKIRQLRFMGSVTLRNNRCADVMDFNPAEVADDASHLMLSLCCALPWLFFLVGDLVVMQASEGSCRRDNQDDPDHQHRTWPISIYSVLLLLSCLPVYLSVLLEGYGTEYWIRLAMHIFDGISTHETTASYILPTVLSDLAFASAPLLSPAVARFLFPACR